MLANTENIVKKINLELSKKSFGEKPEELYKPIEYILSIGGKRLRPLVAVLSYLIFNEEYEKAIKPSLALEVFHNFTLMHDDIMDQAPLRRGQATVHEKWNNSVAILSGDVMLVKAYDLFLGLEPQVLKDVLILFNQCATQVCEGQQLDMTFETSTDISIAEYINMIRLKTAVVLGGALKIGALIGEADEKDADLLSDFGVNLGIAFQLQDDILDVYGDPAKFGKQVGGDIISNKKTYLLIKALQLVEGTDAEELQRWITFTQFDAAEKVAAVTEIYNSVNVRQYAEDEMQAYAEKAFKALEQINLPEDSKQYLRDFADGLLVREY